MNKQMLPISIAFILIGVALFIIFGDSTPGMIGAALFVPAGVAALVRGGTTRN